MATAENVIGYEFHRIFYADSENRCVLKSHEPIIPALTLKEYEVLEFFLKSPGTLFRRNAITPLDVPASGRHPADNYLSRIADKLGLDFPDIFERKIGVGYRLIGDVRPIYASDRQEGGDVFKASEFNFNTHTVDSMRASLSQTERALELNPRGLPEAHVTAAYNHINLCMAAFSAEIPTVGMPKARVHAQSAFKSDPRSSRALGVLGLISMIYDYDLDAAKDQLEAALDLNPNDAATLLSYAHFLIATQHPKEAVAAVERAARIDPVDLIIYASVGWMHLLAGDTARAIVCGEKATFLYPNFPPGHMILGWIYESARRGPDAIKEYEMSLAQEYTPAAVASLGHLHSVLGKRAEAEEYLHSLEILHKEGKTPYVAGYCRALILAGLGENDACLSALEDAYDQRADWLIHLTVEPRWEPVRKTARFRALVGKIGLAKVYKPKAF
jgi:tetratricopeptide (TPR) repeat protein